MKALTATGMLAAWESGAGQQPAQRALTVLGAACPDMPAEVLEAMTIGERDRRLLALRAWSFGPELIGLADCPVCGECLEWQLRVQDIIVPPDERSGDTLALDSGGYSLRFRLPTGADLAEIAAYSDVASARRALLERCVVEGSHDGGVVTPGELPDDVVETLASGMAATDPQADVRIQLGCPACRHAWEELLDVASFFWVEIDAWSRRILRDVHVLASAYGWREADVLALSPARRQCYLEMVAG